MNSHPIQYFAPLYRKMAQESEIDVTVFYGSRQGVEEGINDAGFGQGVVWDTPLLEGYAYKFLKNLGGERGVKGFFSLVNWGIVKELRNGRYDAFLVHGHNFFTHWLAVLAAKLFSIPILMRGETHLLLKRNPFKKMARHCLLPLFYRGLDGFLYISSR